MSPRSRHHALRATRRVRWLKRGMLLVATVGVFGMLALYLLGKAARVAPATTRGDDAALLGDAGASQAGEGFDHTVSLEGTPLFRIRGTRDRRDNEGNLHVDEVLVTLFGEDGRRYELAGDTASYSLEAREARVAGNVRVVAPSGMSLQATALRLLDNGEILESEGRVSFARAGEGGFHGTAGSLRAAPERGHYVLRDGVELESVPGVETPYALTASQLVYLGDQRLLRGEGEVASRWGAKTVAADRVIARLGEDDRVRRVEARWNVVAVIPPSGADGSAVRAEGPRLVLAMSEDGTAPERLELRGSRQDPGLVWITEPTGARTTIRAPYLQADLADEGRIESAYAGRGILLIEEPAEEGAVTRTLGGGRGEAHFSASGELLAAEVFNEVTLAEGERRIRADHLRAGPARVEARGSPAVLVSEQGELRAPAISLDRASGLAHATGGVQATLTRDEENPLVETPLAGRGDEPIRVESTEGFWRDQPRSFLFRGEVRAWSGDQVILAGQLRGDLDESTLSAAGGVETVWFVAGREPGEAARPVRATAAQMIYDDAARQLIYRDDVALVDTGRTLRCRELTVILDEAGEAERMICQDDVELVAPPPDGKRITADRAEYDLASESAVFQGDPVEVEDDKGGRLRGRRVSYDLQTGKVTVAGRDASAAGEGP